MDIMNTITTLLNNNPRHRARAGHRRHPSFDSLGIDSLVWLNSLRPGRRMRHRVRRAEDLETVGDLINYIEGLQE